LTYRTYQAATKPHQNFHTISDSPIAGIARLPVTAKTPSFVAGHGKHDTEDAGSTISRCTFHSANASDSDFPDFDIPDFEADMHFAAPYIKDTGSSGSSAFTSCKDPRALVVESKIDLVDTKADNTDAEKTPYQTQQARPHKSLTKELAAQAEMITELATPLINASDRLTIVHGTEVIKAIAKILAERYAKQQKPPKRKVINGKYPVTKEDFLKRLKGTEEDLHPWATAKKLPGDFLLRRVTDGSSKARRYHRRGIFSQISNSDFTTRQGRHDSIDKHLNYSNREGTAIISMTGSAKDFVENRIRRQDRRLKPEKGDNRELTYVNTLSLNADGVPVLLAEDEVRYYKVIRAIGQDWIKDEYFVPLRIGVKHIVGTWYWSDVQTYMRKHKLTFYDWEKAIVFPAFQKHELARKEGRQYVPEGGCACCPHGFKAMDAPKPRVGADAEKEQ
jgi:hypothetical protein